MIKLNISRTIKSTSAPGGAKRHLTKNRLSYISINATCVGFYGGKDGVIMNFKLFFIPPNNG